MPQTSLAAEYAAFVIFLDNIVAGTYVGDCQEVLDRFSAPFKDSMAHTNPLACFWKSIKGRHGTNLGSRTAVVKTKAHRNEADATDPIDLYRFKGNSVVDVLAKKGAALHAPSSGDVSLYKTCRKDLCNLMCHMVDVMKSLRLSQAET